MCASFRTCVRLCARSLLTIVHPVPNWGVCESRSRWRARAHACALARVSSCTGPPALCVFVGHVHAWRETVCLWRLSVSRVVSALCGWHSFRLTVLLPLVVSTQVQRKTVQGMPAHPSALLACMSVASWVHMFCTSLCRVQLVVPCNSKPTHYPLAASASAAGTASLVCCVVH